MREGIFLEIGIEAQRAAEALKRFQAVLGKSMKGLERDSQSA